MGATSNDVTPEQSLPRMVRISKLRERISRSGSTLSMSQFAMPQDATKIAT